MATTRDQVEAYTYEGRRQVTSLMLGSDEAIQDPRRRVNRVTVGSIVIGVLVMAGFGIAGFLGGGAGPDLPDSGAVLLKGNGDRYVVVNGKVHPALNLASALLVGGGQLIEVKQGVLDSKPRGIPVGIPNAPDALPAKERLTTDPWTTCIVPSESTSVPPKVSLLVGLPAPATGVLAKNAGVITQSPDGTTWLIAEGRRYKLAGNTRVVLGLQRATPIKLPAEVLNTVPEGPEIVDPKVAGVRGGTPTAQLPVTASVGDVAQVKVAGSQTQYFMVQTDGLSPISELIYRLLAASGSKSVEMTPAQAGAVPVSTQPAPGQRAWPDRSPELVDLQREQPLCISTTPGQERGDAAWQVTVSTPPTMPKPAGATPVGSKSGDIPGIVSEVMISPGSGALVKAASASGQDGVFTLVTDAGQRFAFAAPDAVLRLRYNPADAKVVPLPFVAMLPSGPVLDPEAAAKEFTGQ